MIRRIVRLEFTSESLPQFLDLFEKVKTTVRNQEGCLRLELHHDLRDPNALFTVSEWEGEEFLEQYRRSDFFASTWEATKALFGGKPQAWSLDLLQIVAS